MSCPSDTLYPSNTLYPELTWSSDVGLDALLREVGTPDGVFYSYVWENKEPK